MSSLLLNESGTNRLFKSYFIIKFLGVAWLITLYKFHLYDFIVQHSILHYGLTTQSLISSVLLYLIPFSLLILPHVFVYFPSCNHHDLICMWEILFVVFHSVDEGKYRMCHFILINEVLNWEVSLCWALYETQISLYILPIEWELSNKLLSKCHCEGSSNHVSFMSLAIAARAWPEPWSSISLRVWSFVIQVKWMERCTAPISAHCDSFDTHCPSWMPRAGLGVAAVHFLVGNRYHAKSLVSQAVTFFLLSTGWVLFLCVEFHDVPFILDVLWNIKFSRIFLHM